MEEDLNDINRKIDEELILITQEDELLIKEIASDINEKAFYGKMLKKKKAKKNKKNNGGPDEFEKLSPRAREIATVEKFINQCNINAIVLMYL